jgi:nicotinamidase-related amidase
MDYQNGVVDMLGDPDELLTRAADAIALVRDRGAHVGYVRVAFTDADFKAIPPTSKMGAPARPPRRSTTTPPPPPCTTA